jgi:SPP1 gp7 family putative phage head morphogenesis protein
MATAAERATNEAILHRIALNRYSTALVRKTIAQLNRTEKAVEDRLQRAHNEGKDPSRLDGLLKEVRSLQADGWTVVRARLNEDLTGLAGSERDFTADLVKAGAGTLDLKINLPTVSQVMAAVKARPFQGRFLKDWLSEAEEGAAKRVRETIRQGFIEGRTVDQMVTALRGTRANRFKDGILEVNRRGAEAMVRTAVTHTASVASEETYSAMGDLVEGVEWVATLDSRTTVTCASLDGKVFAVGKGPRPPAHVNCRSTTIPRVAGLEPVKRTTYAEWLKAQSPKVQDDILGPSKAALFRTGGLKVDRFTDTTGKVLTLDQLKAKNAAAFTKAGLDHPMQPPRGTPKDEIARFLADDDAQSGLIERLMGGATPATYHRQAVERVAAREKWDAKTNDLMAVRHYTGSSYAGINKRMRENGGTLEDRQFTAIASRGVTDLPDHVGEVWRAPETRADVADRLYDRAVPGQELEVGNQLQSYSTNQIIAAAWSRTANVLFKIRNPKVGAYIEPLSQAPGELEVLFPLGLRYVVVEKRDEVLTVGGRRRLFRVIELEIRT